MDLRDGLVQMDQGRSWAGRDTRQGGPRLTRRVGGRMRDRYDAAAPSPARGRARWPISGEQLQPSGHG